MCVLLITPRTCARDKVCLSVVVSMKIARSHILGIYACYKDNQSVDIDEKLVCMSFELLKKPY